MRYGVEKSDRMGVIIKDVGGYEKSNFYKDKFSDHLPICLTIETKEKE